MRYTSETAMLVSLLLVLLVSVIAFASGFALARRPTLLREAFASALAASRCAAESARVALGRARLALEHLRAGRRAPEPTVMVAAPSALVAEAPAPPPALEVPAPVVVPGIAAETSPIVEVPPAAPPVPSASPLAPLTTSARAPSVRFDPIVPRGTQSAELDLHTPEWRTAMAAVGERFAAGGVSAIVFVHGTFTGSDPLSAYGFVARALPSGIGHGLARSLRQKTRRYIRHVLGDLGNFGTAYVRLFEEAIRPRGARIPCTDFVWSSENHHVGRLEGALGLVRVLATHAELGERGLGDLSGRPHRILVIGHSHAGQLFALVTQLLARSMATEAILDIARARELDVTALEADLATLAGPASGGRRTEIDFVTFGAPNRYAWATVPNVRALHVIAVPSSGGRSAMEGDWIQRLGVEGSDFPPLSAEDRRVNATLAGTLGHAGFAPARVAAALRAGVGLPSNGDVAFVEYGERGLFSTGLGHGEYTRLDGMLFHARLVAERLYRERESEASSRGEAAPISARAWSALRAIGQAPRSTKDRPTP